jgi:hypothetical protein
LARKALASRGAGGDVAGAAVSSRWERMLEELGDERLNARLNLRGILAGVIGQSAERRASLLAMPSAVDYPLTNTEERTLEQSLMNQRYVCSASTVQFVAHWCEGSAAQRCEYADGNPVIRAEHTCPLFSVRNRIDGTESDAFRKPGGCETCYVPDMEVTSYMFTRYAPAIPNVSATSSFAG